MSVNLSEWLSILNMDSAALQAWLSANGAVLLSWSLQFFILLMFVYFLYGQFIRKSQAEQLIKGLMVILMSLILCWMTAKTLGLFMLENIFGASIYLFMMGLIVIFQPELRRILLYLGQPEFFSKSSGSPWAREEQGAAHLVHEVVESVKFLSKSKMGALMVLESPNNPDGGSNYLEAGTPLDAHLSTELLLTLFHPKTPLHDGAVVISAHNRILAAGVLLPLTEDPKLSWQYGTRHRAAIGLTEVSDSTCVVVSEETGAISFVHRGDIEKMGGSEDLQKRLEKLYHVQASSGDKRKVIPFSGDALAERIQKIFRRRDPLNPKKGDKKSGA